LQIDPKFPKKKFGSSIRNVLEVDNEIPVFSQDRNYIDKFVYEPKLEDNGK